MATLQKIRNRGVLLIIVIGAALLAFIIGDFLNHGSTFFGKSKENIAEINGEKIHYTEYYEFLEQFVSFQKIESNQQSLDEETMQQIRNVVWEQLLNNKLLLTETEKIGLTVSTEELYENLLGDYIHQHIQQRRFFADESGRFNRDVLMQFYSFITEESDEYQTSEAIKDYKNYWMFLERMIKTSILEEKYNSLLAYSFGVNKTEAKASFDKNLKSYQVQYFVKPYYDLPDTDFSINSKEIKSFYNDHLYRFRQEPSMSIKYVNFKLDPKEEDFQQAATFIDNLKEEFETTNDVVELVNMNSDIQYTGRNYTQETIPAHYKNFAFSGRKGDTHGPIFENNAYTMARIMETGISLPDSVKLRYTFIANEEEAKDSLVTAFKNKTDDLDAVWIVDGQQGIDKEILKNAFNKGLKEYFAVEIPQGTQHFQIVEKTAPKRKVKIAILEREVIASSQTESQIFNEAKRFAAGLKAENFDSIATQNQYFVRMANDVAQSSPTISNISQSREIVRWAFENDKGSVSDVIECDNELIVAVITDINKENYKSIENATVEIRSELVRDKKAEVFQTEINAKLEDGKSMKEIAAEMEVEIKTADGITFGAYQFDTEGFEPAVIGAVTALGTGDVSSAIKGNSGVYLVQANTITEEEESEFDAESEKNQLRMQYSYYLPTSVMGDMRQNANIKDNRIRFF